MQPRPVSKALPALPISESLPEADRSAAPSAQSWDIDNQLERAATGAPVGLLGLHHVESQTHQADPSGSTSQGGVNDSSPSSKFSRSGSIKGWSPRWAPKVKRNWPSLSSEDVSTAAQQEALSSSIPSPPPALSLDSNFFDQPMLAEGLFAPREASPREPQRAAAHASNAIQRARSSPRLTDPEKTPMPEFLTPRPRFDARMASPSMASSLTATPNPTLINPLVSPALTGLINSFPSPINRGQAQESPVSVPAAPRQRAGGWDGGEIWAFEDRKHAGERFSADESDAALHNTAGRDSRRASRDGNERWARPPSLQRLAPPGPAPKRALPPRPRGSSPNALAEFSNAHSKADLVHGGRSPLKRLTLEGGPPSSLGYQVNKYPARGRPKQLVGSDQRPSSSSERLGQSSGQRGMASSEGTNEGRDRNDDWERPASSNSLYTTASSAASSTTSLVLDPSASTGEIARSLDIPRNAIKQMLETTQHVWRNHALGALLSKSRTSPSFAGRLKRVKSSPDLLDVEAFAFDAGEGSRPGQPSQSESSDSRRASISTLPYLSSARASSEVQWPSRLARDGGSGNTASTGHRGPSLDAAVSVRNAFRWTYLAGKEGGTAATSRAMSAAVPGPNFSRPIPPTSSVDANHKSSARSLGSSVQLNMDGFPGRRVLEEEDEEVLKDLESEEGHRMYRADAPGWTLAGKKAPVLLASAASRARPASRSLDLNRLEALASVPKSSSPPRMERRNSDGDRLDFGMGRRKRQPGELHAWSVDIDETGFPTIRTAPSAFHHPACPLAGKGNATWQCGCRGFDHGPAARASISRVPRFGNKTAGSGSYGTLRAMSSSPNLGARGRSSSLGRLPDASHQAALWEEVERHRAKISQHQAEIDLLQATVERMSFEIASSRPSLSGQDGFEPHGAARFPTMSGSLRSNAAQQPAFSPLMVPAAGRPPLPTPTLPLRFESAFSDQQADPEAFVYSQHEEETLRSKPSFSGSLRRRLSSLNRSQFVLDDDDEPAKHDRRTGGHRLRASSTSSLTKLFSFPWATRREEAQEGSKQAFPQPMPFPYEAQAPVQSTAVPSSSAAESRSSKRPLPSIPGSTQPQQTSKTSSRKYPPSSRKFSFDALSNRAEHSSVMRRHSRDPSGSSRASSYNPSGAGSDNSDAADSRFNFFPRAIRRWDSLSSRATSMSERSVDRTAVVEVKHIDETIHRIAAAPVPGVRLSQDSLRGEKPSAPPRRSSLRAKAEQHYMPTSPSRPSLHLFGIGMAPISELSEAGGTPTSLNRRSVLSGEFEASPNVRMSMGERYVPNALSIPTSLPPSSEKAPLAASAIPHYPGSSLFGPQAKAYMQADKQLPVIYSQHHVSSPVSTSRREL